jgi:hypothetical protein
MILKGEMSKRVLVKYMIALFCIALHQLADCFMVYWYRQASMMTEGLSHVHTFWDGSRVFQYDSIEVANDTVIL